MSGLAVTASLAPLILLLAVVATDIWVYLDATVQWERGNPVVASIGSFRVDTPGAWFVCCLVLWIVFFPLYLIGRGHGVT